MEEDPVNGGSGGDAGSGGTNATAGSSTGATAGGGGDSASAGASGTAGSGGVAGGECFSPLNPPTEYRLPGNGCDCSDVPLDEYGQFDICLVTPTRGQIVLGCRGDRWIEGVDGQCRPDLAWASRCQVTGPDYTQIAYTDVTVPSPYSFCNSCTCGADGRLKDCTTNECAEEVCPSGTVRGERCIGCKLPGRGGGCDIVETGCLPTCESDADCSGRTPKCQDGVCAVDVCPLGDETP